MSLDLNNPERFYLIRSILEKKEALKKIYIEIYHKYNDCIKNCPQGKVLEIGSGGGFLKEIYPNIITSDVIPYPNIDIKMDATKLEFPDNSLSCICMFNVLHHIPNSPNFFREANRCLMPGGRIFMVEPYAGLISSIIFRYLHHEGFDRNVKNWEFESKGPVSDANNALPSIIFERDIEKFRQTFPQLAVLRFEPNMPFRYWLTGGLKKWSLLPGWAYEFSCWIDKMVTKISPRLGSFVDIELIKI